MSRPLTSSSLAARRPDELGRSFHAGLLFHQVHHGVSIGRRDIEHEDIRHSGRRGASHLCDDAVLHQIDRERKHHADAQRHQHRLGMIAGAVQVRDAMPHRRRQVAAAQSAQPAQHQPGDPGESREAAHQGAGEVFADSPHVGARSGGKRHGDSAESDHDADARQDRRAFLHQANAPGRFDLCHLSSQNQIRADPPDAQQRRQREQQRRQHCYPDALRRGDEIQTRGWLDLEIAFKKLWKGRLHDKSECDTEQAAGQAERNGLDDVDAHQVSRARA